MSSGPTYKDAGVDIEAADRFVDGIGKAVRATHKGRVLPLHNAFAGLVRPDLKGMSSPLIAASCDGVGTKLLVAKAANNYRGLGQDLVAMNVNDLLPAGAKPLFFLDYIATGQLNKEILTIIVEGIAQACNDVNCALLGGETAEMPDVYRDGDFDLAGFAVGMVDESKIQRPNPLEPGDVVFALLSSGVHSNGFSLVRHVLGADTKILAKTPKELEGQTIAEALLAPTCLYVNEVLSLLENIQVKAAAHITGGGLLGRLRSMLGKGGSAVGIQLDPTAYRRPPIFNIIQSQGSINEASMANTFNMGLGYVLVVNAEEAQKLEGLNAHAHFQKVGHLTNSGKVDLGYAQE